MIEQFRYMLRTLPRELVLRLVAEWLTEQDITTRPPGPLH